MELFIDPVIFKIGFFELRWYSVAYIAGFLCAWFLMLYINKFSPIKLTKQNLDSLLNYCIFGVILGGRLGFVLFYEPTYFLYNPNKIFAVWEGGMSFHGGLIGVLIAIFLFCRFNKLSLWNILDRSAICVLPGLFFGRIANFINGELWGKETNLPIGFIFPESGTLIPRHPSQLYEAVLEGLIPFVVFIILLNITNLIARKGRFSALFLIFYGLARFIVEAFFREPHGIFNFGIFEASTGQLLSFPMILLGMTLLIKNYLKKE